MNDPDQSFREVLIGRQPILDLKQELVGYELLFRAPGQCGDESPHPDCSLTATAGVVCTAFAELGIDNALGPHKAFINADERFILDDALELLPPDGVVLELDFTEAPSEALLARVRCLRERGYTLALSRYGGLDERSTALLPLVGIVKIDVLAAGDNLAKLAGSLTRLPIKLLAEKVESRAQMEQCRAYGFHLFQGYYFARPTIISGRQLTSSQVGIIRLVNLVARDAEVTELEDSFKREPGLTVNLLRLVNSVGMGVGRRVDSLRHAVNILGRRQLLRWLQLLLMASPEHGAQPERNPLLQLAALRGRLMEILASRLKKQDQQFSDHAFLCGIMSLMPAALGLPMHEILEQVAVTSEMQEALSGHAGRLGTLLDLIEQLDAGNWEACDALLAQSRGLTRETLTTALTDGLAWIHAEHD
jgi:EAL and modified HD-GYP domain-containing signal transduction protein